MVAPSNGSPVKGHVTTLKYKSYSTEADPLSGTKRAPTQLINDLKRMHTHKEGWRPKPRIIEFLNLADYTHQVNCSVGIDEPIFQPFPPEITFHGYEPFKAVTATLYLRNNDTVPRRIKVLPPDTPHFSITRILPSGGAAEEVSGGKIASGMEASFLITFSPSSTDDYSCELIVCTEREKFVVPLIAKGAAAALDFPDMLDFGLNPCKVEAKRSVLVRNVGQKAAAFTLRAPPPFTASPGSGSLAPGETLQCVVLFVPPTSGTRYSSELEVRYDTGDAVYCQLLGEGQELAVGLSQESVTMTPTFVTRMSQQTFQIVNDSAIAVTYSVRAHASSAEEFATTAARLAGLGGADGIGFGFGTGGKLDIAALYGGDDDAGGFGNGHDPSLDPDSEDEEAILANGVAATGRSFKSLRRGALLDRQLFQDPNFLVSPAEGLVWPGQKMEVLVQFSPDHARDYDVMAYVEMQGRSERVPIAFRGTGLGPAALFSYDVLDVGDTFANTLHTYEVELQNRGQVDVEFNLQPPTTPFGQRFAFEPSSGRLARNEVQLIRVSLCSELLGVFDETFLWTVRGASAPLALQFRGRVTAPTFEADVTALDFGIVSYGFRYTREFGLTNTSEVPMRFAWRVPDDGSPTREFQVSPLKGSIPPHGRASVSVEFVSSSVRKYALDLVMDIPGVADAQLLLPMRAECAVPMLSLYSEVLDFGGCFIRHPYKQLMKISNESKLPAKFEILPQDPQSAGLATFIAEPSSGGIAAKGEVVVELCLSTLTLGRVQVPVRVAAVGSRGPPLECIIDARSLGPSLELGLEPEQRLPGIAVRMDKIAVLKEHTVAVYLHNPCLIAADIKLFIEAKESVFSVTPRSAHLEPGESMMASVCMTLDEAQTFKDVLHVLVSEGADICVPLEATGTGNTLVSDELGEVLDFSHQFVGRPFQQEVWVHNQGRKTMQLWWSSVTAEEVKKTYGKATRGTGKKFDMATMVPLESQPVFTIYPEKLTVRSKESVPFVVSGLAHRAEDLREQLTCLALVEGATKGGRKVFDTTMHARVVTPLLDFSERTLHFLHQYVKGAPIELITKPLVIKNTSRLPLTFHLRTQPPFSLDVCDWTLAMGESAEVAVTFDPNFKGDLQSAQIHQKLSIIYSDNPQKDSVDLTADIDFPNLKLDQHKVEFGSVLVDTTRHIPVGITNSSNVDVVFSWAWDKQTMQEDANSMLSVSLTAKAAAKPRPPPSQLFDIMPIRGILRPGQTEVTTFSFFAFPGMKASASAVCSVEGGPTYTVTLGGESNNIKWSVEPQYFDMGVQMYDRPVDKELVIHNQGKVPFDYRFNMGALSRPGVVEALPPTGRVGPGVKEVVKLRACAGIPERLVETVSVEVAHFDPVSLQVVIEGVYAGLTLGLPRHKDELFEAALENAKEIVSRSPPRSPVRGNTGHSMRTRPISPDKNGALVAHGTPEPSTPAAATATAGGRSSADIHLAPLASAGGSAGGAPVSSAAESRPSSSNATPGSLIKPLAVAHGAGESGLHGWERRVEVEADRLRLVQVLLAKERDRAAAQRSGEALSASLTQSPDMSATAMTLTNGDISLPAVRPASRTRTLSASSTAAKGAAGGDVHAVLDQDAQRRTSPVPSTSAPASSPPAHGRRGKALIQPPLPSLVSAHYVLDFGYVMKGTTKVRKFKMTNTSTQQVTFRFDKGILESWGFKVTPEAVSKLPGAPDCGSAEVAVTLQANKAQVEPGPMELTLPLPIKGGPAILLTLRAHIQQPDLKLSKDILDFGKCQAGMCKVFTLQLHNSKQIPCEWAIKRPMEPQKCKDWDFFTYEPSEGVLEPDQRLNVKVMFTPAFNREAPYSQIVPLKVATNSKSFLVTGKGDTPKVLFSPTTLDCGPILPKFEGQVPAEVPFKLTNPCTFDIEVVSLDFDRQYLAVEETLKSVSGYNVRDIMYLAPLPPGAPLWPDIVEEAARKRAMEAVAMAVAAEAATADGSAAADGIGSEFTTAAVGDLEAVAAGSDDVAAAATPGKLAVVLAAPELVDLSEQAAKLAARYGLLATSIDDLLLEAADLEPPAGWVPPPPPPPVPNSTPPVTPPPPATAKGASAAAPVPTPPITLILDPPPHPGDPSQPYFDHLISDLLFEQVLTDPDLEGSAGYIPPHTKLQPAALTALLTRALTHALSQPQYSAGVVLQGLSSRYGDASTLSQCFLKALGLQPQLPPPPEPEPVDPKAKPVKPKTPKSRPGDPPPPPPPPIMPLGWTGPCTVQFVELLPDPSVLTKQLAQQKLAAAVTGGAETSAASEPAAPPEAVPPASATPLAPSPSGEEGGESEVEKTPEQLAALEVEGMLSTFGAGWSQLREWLGPAAPDNRVLVRKVDVAQTEEATHLAVCGLSFKLGALSLALPSIASDAALIPEPYLMQVVPKPRSRPARAPIAHFKLFTVPPEGWEPPPPPPPVEETPSKGSKAAKSPSKAKGSAEPPPPLSPSRHLWENTRWVIPAGSSIECLVQFQSEEVGKFAENLAFEVVGGEPMRQANLAVVGTCDHPHISSDYRNVFYKKVKARPQTPTIRHQYVISRSDFEFGPLLYGKDPSGYWQGAHPDNTARIRITNNGLFDNSVEFSLKSRDTGAGAAAAAAAADTGKGKKGGKADGKASRSSTPPANSGKDAKLDGVFVLNPPSMSLKIDETQELTLYAFPTEAGPVTDVIVCRIMDNPMPVEFPITVIGAKPQVHIRLDDGTPFDPAAPAPAPPPTPPTPSGKGGKGAAAAAAAAADAGPPNKIMTEGLLFERLLVGKHDSKTFIINNTGLLPFKWRLAGADKLPAEFSISPTSGELEARSDVRVVVDFKSLEKRMVEHKLVLEVLDKAELQGVAHAIPLPVKGEAYKIEQQIIFPQEGASGVDFGTVRVVDEAERKVVIKNTGKYAIAYSFTTKAGIVKDVVAMLPESGNVEPGKEVAVMVQFNKKRTLKRELTLVGNADITLSIIEPLTQKPESSVPIKVSLRALFSKYAITPARGINFGPITYKTSAKPKTFEVMNLGEFPFTVKLSNKGPAPDSRAPTPLSGKASKDAAKAGKGPAVVGLPIGPFAFSPSEFTVQPGATAEVSVTFAAEGSASFLETLGVDVSERDPADSPGGAPYEIAGESCIPGIDADNLHAIFEEHTISTTLDPFNPVPNEFGTRERVFNFGAVIAQLAAATSDAPPPTAAASSPSASTASPIVPVGVRANLKFINPVKVPCVVNFAIKSRTALPAGVNFPVEMVPAQLVIPPHEYRYMSVVFNPRAIQQYSGTFTATVENGSDPKTKAFTCEMRGEGTLPSLTILEPTIFDPSGCPLLKFGRLMRGRMCTLSINLKNNGVLPAKARIEMAPHAAFTLLEGSQSFEVESKKGASFSVQFDASTVGPANHELKLRVSNNPYEDYRVVMTGEGYQDDVTFDGLPDGALDELRLPDGPVGRTCQSVFALKNHSQKNFRFKWPVHPNLTFTPGVGHLLAGSSKTITLTFKADVPVKLSPQATKMVITAITYKSGTPVDWDDTPVVEEFGAPAAAIPPTPTAVAGKRGSSAKPDASAAGPNRRCEPEPAVTDVAGSAKEMLLQVHATADNAKYACELKPIVFKPTMMFQTRTFTFPLTNTSSARLDYRFSILQADGVSPDTSGLYSISPSGGVVEAGQSASITVKFSPSEVEPADRVLVCEIPNLDASLEPLVRSLTGRVLRPWAHFELPDSDYVSGGRRAPEMPGPTGVLEPLDPATKTLEFESLGVQVRNTNRFFVLNPTGVAYEFFWTPANKAQEGASPFACITKRGIIGGGRRFEMVFEYTPSVDAVAESFWTFSIPEQNISVPFLLVGSVIEPRVFFDRPSVNFGQVLIGARSQQTLTLVNNEVLPFHFSLDKASYEATDELIASTGQQPLVVFEPSSGSVPARSSLPIRVSFMPRQEQDTNYNVMAVVKKKPSKLTLNIKGEGYTIHESLQVESADGSVLTLAPRQPNTLDFGQVIINERSVKAISMVNAGTMNYDFSWDVGTNPRLSMKPESGCVPKGERLTCELTYNPHVPDRLRDYKVTCSIVNGNRYTLLLNGVGHKPRLDLSFFTHDFGAAPLWQPGMTPAAKILRLRNDDNQPISVDPHIDPVMSEGWELDAPSTVLQPGESKEFTVKFKPLASQPYHLLLPLEVNGLYTVNVDFNGTGSPLALELVNPAQRTVNFGPSPRGSTVTRVVGLINRGKMAVTVSAAPSAEMLKRCCVEVQPAREITLRPRESADLTLYFRPTGRMRAFSEELLLDVSGVPLPLMSLAGACLGTELKLAGDNLPFGPVTLGSRSVKRLQLENTGDVGTKFIWDTAATGPHFSISPAEGFLNPQQTVNLDVTFHPTRIHADIRVEKIRLKVEGGEERQLTLTGACIATSAQAEAVTLSCNVRASTSHSITLSNPSSSPWQLKPVIQNEFFSGPEFINVPANSKASYPITFKPLAMSSAESPHEGSVFFPIPDGSGLLYRLLGKAEVPVPEGSIVRDIAAKAPHVEVLKVANWLHRPQRFKVIIDRTSVDRATTLEGAEYVDVPALSNKDYKLSCYSYTTGSTAATVTFRNETSGEYSFYNLKLNAGAPAVCGSISLECPVRTQAVAKVTVKNPLPEEVTLRASCSSRAVLVPATTVLRGGMSTDIELRYRPLLVGDATASLKLECAELGLFEYNLKLAGLSTTSEKTLTYSTALGNRETQVFRFMHWLEEKAEYKVSFKSAGSGSGPGSSPRSAAGAASAAQFTTASSVTAPGGGATAGVEVSLEVHYEPTMIGDNIRDTLIVSSATGGEYQCPLLGRCVPPKPQGPIDVAKGSGSVPFTNVFPTDAEFVYSVDNPAFSVKPGEKLGAKKAGSIAVGFKPVEGRSRTGKLTVSCPAQTSSQWVFYLQA